MVDLIKHEARVYLRRSDSKQEESLEQQLDWALGRARQLGVMLNATPVDLEYMRANHLLRYKDIYLDDRLKGDDLTRPGFVEMCQELLGSHDVGWLFCRHRDRLGRPQDLAMFEMALTEIRIAQSGVSIVYPDRILTPADAERDAFSQVLLSSVDFKGAGDFLVMHAERVIVAQQRLAKEGWWTGGKPLYGFSRYLFGPDGKLVEKLPRGKTVRAAGYHVKMLPDREDPIRYVALKAMIEWWRQGLGYVAIATRLNELGVPSPDAGQVRTEQGATHRLSGRWGSNTVKMILTNPRIAGVEEFGRRSEGRLRRVSGSGPRKLDASERKATRGRTKRRNRLRNNPAEDRIRRDGDFEPLIPYEEWLSLVERSRRRGATQEGQRRPKQVRKYALGVRVFDQTDGCGHPLYGRMRDGKPEYMCGQYMKSQRTRCHSNSVDGEQMTKFVLATLREQVLKAGGREALRQRLTELAGEQNQQPTDPGHLERIALEAKIGDLRRKLELASRNILEVETPTLIKAMEKRYAEDERELSRAEAELARLPLAGVREAVDLDTEVEVAMRLFDDIERLAEHPTANEAINVLLERLGLRVGLFFEDGKKGTRNVRKVAKGVIALGDLPLPVPLYGEPQVLPAATLDETLQRRLAAEIEVASQSGATAPRIEHRIKSTACLCENRGHAEQPSTVAARCRDDVSVDRADPPAYGDGRGSRPTGTVPEGIVPSRAQQGVAAAGLEPATPGL